MTNGNDKIILGTYTSGNHTSGNHWTGIGRDASTIGIRIAGDPYLNNPVMDVGWYWADGQWQGKWNSVFYIDHEKVFVNSTLKLKTDLAGLNYNIYHGNPSAVIGECNAQTEGVIKYARWYNSNAYVDDYYSGLYICVKEYSRPNPWTQWSQRFFWFPIFSSVGPDGPEPYYNFP